MNKTLSICCAFVLSLASCSDEVLAPDIQTAPNSGVCAVQILNGNIISGSRGNENSAFALAFPDEQCFNDFKSMLEGLSYDERMDYIETPAHLNSYAVEPQKKKRVFFAVGRKYPGTEMQI